MHCQRSSQPFTHWPTHPRTHRQAFLRAARRSLGRTALCLSGGGSMAMYHLGVVRALIEAGVFRYIKARTLFMQKRMLGWGQSYDDCHTTHHT